jgi:hypothetical protein
MRETALPEGDAPLAARSLAACLAAILELPVEDVPCSETDDATALVAPWLATRNLALVPVLDAESFQWGGWWIARLSDRSGEPGEDFVVMAGTPSGLVWAPARPDTDAVVSVEVAEGWVLAPPALALDRSGERRSGIVEGLYRARASGVPMESLESVLLLQGAGVDGDRYSSGHGRFSASGRSGQAVTLIEAEAIEALREEHGVELAPGDARRNVVTRGINLNLLLGRRFRLGEADCLGQRVAEPCAWLQQQTPAGTLRGLVHRGGLRADVLTGGAVRIGDAVELL